MLEKKDFSRYRQSDAFYRRNRITEKQQTALKGG